MLMPVPFGFSVGDFIGSIGLLIDAVKSLRKTCGTQDDYKELGRELKHLRDGLECMWALWKKADITEFKSEVQKHAEAIHLLLAKIQM